MQHRPANPHFRNFTMEEYLALEQASDRRWEYWNGEIVCVNGIRKEHTLISSNLFAAFALQLDRSTYRAFSGSMPTKTPSSPSYRYPDLTIVGNDSQFERVNDRDLLLNPLLVIEIMLL